VELGRLAGAVNSFDDYELSLGFLSSSGIL
jgi:hypothetical protein